MGLDTVELVVAFEEHFQLAIPNRVAETIGTVEQAAAAIAHLKGLPADPARTEVYYQLLARLLACLPPRHPAPTEATLLVQLELLGTNKVRTHDLAACLQLQMPDLPPAGWQPRLPGWWQRLFGTAAAPPHAAATFARLGSKHRRRPHGVAAGPELPTAAATARYDLRGAAGRCRPHQRPVRRAGARNPAHRQLHQRLGHGLRPPAKAKGPKRVLRAFINRRRCV